MKKRIPFILQRHLLVGKIIFLDLKAIAQVIAQSWNYENSEGKLLVSLSLPKENYSESDLIYLRSKFNFNDEISDRKFK